MDRSTGGQSIADAVRHLFGVKLAELPGLKNKINSLIRNGLIEIIELPRVQRDKKQVPKDQLVTLHNAIILQLFLPDPKRVKQVFDDPSHRHTVALTLRAMLLDRQSLVGISLVSARVEAFLRQLASDANLRFQRLELPFSKLPVHIYEGSSEILNELIAQSATYDAGDAMMAHFLRGDIEAANEAAHRMTTDNAVLKEYRDLVHKKYQEVTEFDQLLDILR